ncbi:protein angel homolog 1 [Amia ocellicauda]|uniref:protein angel homolog 1 n=1 Tax=Amia ocellicauda TaxID=2972642 RepID=UPI003463FB86
MIGSLVCFVLFPLSRLIHRFTGGKQKHDHPKEQTAPLPMNDKEIWDGGGLWPGSPTQEQTAGLQPEGSVGSTALQVGSEESATCGALWEIPQGRTWSEEGVAQSQGEASITWADLERDDPNKQYAGDSSTALDLGALLSEDNALSWGNVMGHFQAGWHFPAGPGLQDVVYCPSWQLQGMSYYPPEETVPFEVVWRVWEDVSGLRSQSAALQGFGPACQLPFEFTVMSYNILSQDLLDTNPDLYTHCVPEVLAWEFRFQNILKEFRKWEPDILCLQEAQENHFREQLEPFMSAMGYACIYKRRTGSKTDGCAICYQRKKFSEVSVSLVEFYKPQMEVLNRDNIGLLALLQPITPEGLEVGGQKSKAPPICIANTHLLFNPRRGDVKLAQLAVLMAEIDQMVKPWQEEGVDCPVILCGDFNSVPNMPLYQFIRTGQLYYHGLPAWMISGQEDLSNKLNQNKLYAPLWPSSLGISDTCQYFTVCGKERKTSGQKIGKLQYSPCFLLQFRFCEVACTRPPNLVYIPGVTDATPDPTEIQSHVQPSASNPFPETFFPRLRNTIYHGFNLLSVYRHCISGTERPEVTTVHSGFGATVDYIFYSAVPARNGNKRGGRLLQEGPLKLIGRLSLLSEEELWSMNGLPNEIYSSDHLCLLASFQLDPAYF